MTAEEHLRQDVGALVASLLCQIALLKAENETLRGPRAPLAPDKP